MKIWQALIVTSLIAAPGLATATTISYAVTQVDAGTNRWQYDYTVANDSLAAPLGELTVFFDLARYSSLIVVATPANWDSLVAQPDPNLPDAGFLDSLALVNGISTGSSLGGFSVSAIYLGADTPGSQRFDILDANFATVDGGFTHPIGAAAVAEPTSLSVLGLALFGLGALGRRRLFSARG